jgi:hypothetical protein
MAISYNYSRGKKRVSVLYEKESIDCPSGQESWQQAQTSIQLYISETNNETTGLAL